MERHPLLTLLMLWLAVAVMLVAARFTRLVAERRRAGRSSRDELAGSDELAGPYEQCG